jgi:PIN domain nuclease of toxin-antitoxin system
VILLLDTNALIWWLADDGSLKARAEEAIRSPKNDVLVSAASVWEIELKRARGTLEAPTDVIESVERAGFSALPIQAVDAVRSARLPPHHRDPFDRVLVAQAQRVDAVIVTRDSALGAYGVPLLEA